MNYKELIDPELRKSANSFPFNPAIVAVGNLYQDLEPEAVCVAFDRREPTFRHRSYLRTRRGFCL